MLTREDIGDLLAGFAAAIELDQIRADFLPPAKYRPIDEEGMWRNWRRDHLEVIDRLLLTVKLMPTSLLIELSRLATTCNASLVREEIVDLLSEAALGSRDDEFRSASLLFGWLIRAGSGGS